MNAVCGRALIQSSWEPGEHHSNVESGLKSKGLPPAPAPQSRHPKACAAFVFTWNETYSRAVRGRAEKDGVHPPKIRRNQSESFRRWGTADGAQGFLVPALKSRLQVWRKVSQGRMKIGASFRFGFSPMGGCQRRTARMAPAIGGVKLVVYSGGSVHRLAHATGMWGRCGDRQSDGGYRAHEQQDKQ